MKLQEIDTLKDLKEWVEENMQGAEVYEDMHGTLVIRTNLVSTMGGYLHEMTQECDECGAVKGEACSPKCKKEDVA